MGSRLLGENSGCGLLERIMALGLARGGALVKCGNLASCSKNGVALRGRLAALLDPNPGNGAAGYAARFLGKAHNPIHLAPEAFSKRQILLTSARLAAR